MREIHSFRYAPDLPRLHEIQNARNPPPLDMCRGIQYDAANESSAKYNCRTQDNS